MGYVEELRRLIGHRPLLLPGANVLVLDGAGRVLLQRRRDTGEWGVIGGGLELDETVEEAARREVREETGLEIGELTLVDVVAGPRFRRTYPNGDVVHAVGAVFATRDVRGEPRPDMSEVVELRYFGLDELPVELMHDSSRFVLERYLKWRDRAVG
ncbi:MAG TPA: NUDIX hydrolase [Chloroflexota bacterium]|jgi:8-oxo-dGTP pyrophosphatase MutT (NUDIX family)|nr:NUDIX hydrolase [Chloroflexota bacterium]